MKKLMVIVFSLLAVVFNANAINDEYVESGLFDLVMVIESNLMDNGYAIQKMTSNEIYAIKIADVDLSNQVSTKENDNYVTVKVAKKVSVPTITVTFEKVNGNYVANVEKEQKNVSLREIVLPQPKRRNRR